MLSRVYTPACFGLEGELVEIECDLANGLPGFIIVGLADKAVDEARERVRSAIKNSGLLLPPRRITLNLAPADLPKDGTGYDLGLAIAILVASGQIRPEAIQSSLFIGELALDGGLRPVKGSLLASQLGQNRGFSYIYVPASNAAEAALLTSIKVISVTSLRQLYHHLSGIKPLNVVPNTTITPMSTAVEVNLSHVYGQEQARRALEIAASGGHNLLLSGPPGSGKTLMAKALVSLLPPPNYEEVLEITQLHSLAGLTPRGVIQQRPFRAPHHSASSAALIGGGQVPRPGEISLSHHGVLLLDELPEFPRYLLEMLRQPLEDGRVTIARATRTLSFPAQFMLVATCNPCPCGYAGSNRCTCTAHQVIQYQRRLSGPLLDRIDLQLNVGPINRQQLVQRHPSESSTQIAARVARARQHQGRRFQLHAIKLNSQMTNELLDRYCLLDPPSQRLAQQAISQFQLSGRAYGRILKVARTIADLAGADHITQEHFSEALQYRARD